MTHTLRIVVIINKFDEERGIYAVDSVRNLPAGKPAGSPGANPRESMRKEMQVGGKGRDCLRSRKWSTMSMARCSITRLIQMSFMAHPHILMSKWLTIGFCSNPPPLYAERCEACRGMTGSVHRMFTFHPLQCVSCDTTSNMCINVAHGVASKE